MFGPSVLAKRYSLQDDAYECSQQKMDIFSLQRVLFLLCHVKSWIYRLNWQNIYFKISLAKMNDKCILRAYEITFVKKHQTLQRLRLSNILHQVGSYEPAGSCSCSEEIANFFSPLSNQAGSGKDVLADYGKLYSCWLRPLTKTYLWNSLKEKTLYLL